jgi:hypothetical protein
MTMETNGPTIPEELLGVFTKHAVDAVLTNIAEAARSHWIKLAGDGLHSTRRDYIAGIQPVDIMSGKATITLVGVLPNLIENGMDRLDLHATLLGPKVPVAPLGERGKHARQDGGFFRAVPFRHRAPTSSAAGGQRFGDPYQGHEAVADARKLGREIYAMARARAPTTTQPYGGPARAGECLAAGLAPKLKPHHAIDIYAGLIREEKTYERATQSQYFTFRMISTGSPGWIRPATRGVHHAQEVARFAARIAPQAFQAYAEGPK